MCTPSSATVPASAKPESKGSPALVKPEGMNFPWFEALQRLSRASGAALPACDAALTTADGDELSALRTLARPSLTPTPSAIQIQREEAVARARAAGDTGRVSAVKEAELRRIATGSARDYFKSFVDVNGDCVEDGMVDESADVMGKVAQKFKGLFGKK